MLGKRLALIRDVLRERLPYCTVREEEPLGLHVDEIHALDDRIFWLKGWLWDVDTPLESLTFMSPEGCSVEVLDSAFRYRRRDIEELYADTNGHRPDSGFLACVRLDVPSRLSSGWIAQLRNVLGMGVEVKGPAVSRGRGRLARRSSATWVTWGRPATNWSPITCSRQSLPATPRSRGPPWSGTSITARRRSTRTYRS